MISLFCLSKTMQKSASPTQMQILQVKINYMTADEVFVNVISVFSPVSIFFPPWRMRPNRKTSPNRWMGPTNERTNAIYTALVRCTALLSAFYVYRISVRRIYRRCVTNTSRSLKRNASINRVCVSRMFCANCVSAITFNIIFNRGRVHAYKHKNINE